MMNALKIWMLCDLDCPLRQFLNLDLETGLERVGPEPPGVSVCGAKDPATWEAHLDRIPLRCPIRRGVAPPWARHTRCMEGEGR